MNKGEKIAYFIFKDVSEYSFMDWLEDREISETDWDKFMEAGKRAFSEGEQEDWIPFTYRTPTEGEKEDHPDWDYILDCKLPEDGQRILVTIEHSCHEPVQLDEFYYDSDGCYLDSGYDIGYGEEAIAWMPLPEPYRGE